MDNPSEAPMEPLVTKNNIRKGSTVIYIGDSRVYPAQSGLAKQNLKKDIYYTVEFVFPGDPMQIEIEGIEPLFVYDMFKRIPPRPKMKTS